MEQEPNGGKAGSRNDPLDVQKNRHLVMHSIASESNLWFRYLSAQRVQGFSVDITAPNELKIPHSPLLLLINKDQHVVEAD
ncbi:hypothetical protein Pla22_19990 [Rubripirellula amarantea]|uniref:Uncharacterized protein n=1 Tax=Rubripirellula amarantea TaxID=2527999 RepID=A0A5C5WWW1_9BACT|nr:hypothetical protein Pla22_19990 [Rubripirellula amarantea]